MVAFGDSRASKAVMASISGFYALPASVIVSREGTAAEQEVMRRIVELGRQRGFTVDFKNSSMGIFMKYASAYLQNGQVFLNPISETTKGTIYDPPL